MSESRKLLNGDCLLIRADAGPAIGVGHVMRCLALAQQWQTAGGVVRFACAALPETLRERLKQQACDVSLIDETPGSERDAEDTARLAAKCDAKVIVVDGYAFDASFRRQLSHAGCRLLLIDDGAACNHQHADWLLNQNLSAAVQPNYDDPQNPLWLLGPRYALLGRQFHANQKSPRHLPRQANKILVTLGGADPPNATLQVIEALSSPEMGDFKAVVVVGGSNPHRASLEASAASAPGRIRLTFDARNMALHMAWADIAVAGGGSTLLELACLGVPALLILIAENQILPAESAARHGIARVLGRHDELNAAAIARSIRDLCHDTDLREQMMRRGQQTVDGLGAARVVRTLSRPQVRLRAATAGDCRRWWQWRNEAEVRRVSFNSAEILYETHAEWFRRSLGDTDRRLLIVENAARDAIGFVRLDLQPQAVEISLGLDAAHRGSGYGEPILRHATNVALQLAGERPIDALVKPDNLASQRVFEHADFEVVERLTVQGQPALRLRHRLTAGPAARAGANVVAELRVTLREIAAQRPLPRGPLALRLNESDR
jgi:UDP-2,4-diacetamido-2,4,6-trideoxy-beta-L-altropyranose hydrolase